MAVFSDAAVRAMLDALETAIGAAPQIFIYDAAQPADTTSPDVGNVLADAVLPNDWMANASGRSKALLGLWRDTAANAAGVPAGYAIKQGGTVWVRGTCSADPGSGEIKFTNTPFVIGQQIDVTAFTLGM